MKALEIKNLSISFNMYQSSLRKSNLKVISNLNICLHEGQILAIAGSSGSGKSLLAHAILGILPNNAKCDGTMLWYGEPLTQKIQKKLRGRELALVPQSITYLDPIKRIGKQISEDKAKTVAALKRYDLSEKITRLYPFELSGGMARRVLLSTAVAGNAKVIIADEPTPGLSKELAETAMSHFRELADLGAAVLLITHELDLALRYADRIAVFYAGTTVEIANASDFEYEELLRHPYSRALWNAMPQNNFKSTPGVQPYAGTIEKGCVYAPRCNQKTAECEQAPPPMRTLRNGEVSCYHAT